MITKYRTATWTTGKLIEKVEVDKETDKSVWIGGSRLAKLSGYLQYHDTWEEAQLWLLERAEARLNSARLSLEISQDYYGNIKGLREDAD